MRIAVLFNGNIRTLEQCKENILKSFSIFNVDYFATTYFNKFEYHPYIQQTLNYYDDDTFTEEQVVEQFSEFNLKDILIERVEDVEDFYSVEKEKFNANMLDFKSSYLQYRKFKTGLDLIKNYELQNDIKYDVVIKTRCDLIHKDLSILNFDNVHEKVICCTGNVILNDQIVISTLDNLDNVVSFMVKEFYDFTNPISREHSPHCLLEYSIKKHNLKVETLPLLECIVRETGVRNYI